MSVLVSAATLGLAWFAAVNAIVSLVVWPVSLSVGDHIDPDPRRSRMLLVLRLLPFGAAATVAVALFIPAHIRLEPVHADERYGVMLLALAAAGGFLLVRSTLRVANMIVASQRLAAVTQGSSRNAAGFPESSLVHGVALVGIVRPRVVIGTRTRRLLTKAELDVAIAHELSHAAALDNLTRALIYCVPDILGFTSAARRLERLWDAHAECLADARAVGGSPDRADRLASALVKVARLGTPEWAGSMALSLFHRSALLEIRIRRLVDRDPEFISSRSRRAALPSLVTVVIGAAWVVGFPSALHRLTEVLVAYLP